MEYALIAFGVIFAGALVVFLGRSLQGPREASYIETSYERSFLRDQDDVGSSEAARQIFSVQDEQFVSAERDQGLLQLFRHERKRLALRWIARQKFAAAAIMRDHWRVSRTATDLQPAAELRLLVRYAQLKLTCEFLLVVVWLFGPQGWRGLAEQAEAACHGVRVLGAGTVDVRRRASA